jgi:hypothetical protein
MLQGCNPQLLLLAPVVLLLPLRWVVPCSRGLNLHDHTGYPKAYALASVYRVEFLAAAEPAQQQLQREPAVEQQQP